MCLIAFTYIILGLFNHVWLKYDPLLIQQALELIAQGQSYRKTSLLTKIPKTTLHRLVHKNRVLEPGHSLKPKSVVVSNNQELDEVVKNEVEFDYFE